MSTATNNQEGALPNSNSGSPGLFSHFREDFLASIVVFLVALPLCIGIAVAVGVSPARALLTGIIGGLFVGFIAGSPLQVSGPAAGLFVIVADLLANGRSAFLETAAGAGKTVESSEAIAYSLVILGAAVFMAGILQIIAGRLRLGQWFRAVSPAVIKGMLAGIGVLILVSQFHVMLDHQAMWGDQKAHGGLQYMATIPEAILKCFSDDTTHNHHLAALTGIITLVTMVLWPLLSPKKLRILPAALIGILVATAFAAIAQLDVQMLKVPDNLMTEITWPSVSWFELYTTPLVLTAGVVIALVASAETLLCATAVDQMHSGERTKYDKELTAQGVGNALCGLIGALPMTGVIVRSTANVSSGGRTRLSTILHGAWLLLFVVAFPFLLSYIPRSALGALLVYTGYKLVNFKEIKKLWKAGRSEAGIFFVTLIVIVSVDLLVGVIIGVALSAIKLLHRFSYLELKLVFLDDGVVRLKMNGAATFLRLPLLAAKLEAVPPSAELHVDFENLTYIDHACLELLMSWAKQHEGTGGKLFLDWESLAGRFSAANGNGKKPSLGLPASTSSPPASELETEQQPLVSEGDTREVPANQKEAAS